MVNSTIRNQLEQALILVKKNYDGCKKAGSLNELLHGKYKKSFFTLINSTIIDLVNDYAYQYITEAAIVTSDGPGNECINSIIPCIEHHRHELKVAIIHGDIDEIDDVLSLCRDEWMNVYIQYMLNNFDAIV